MWAERAGPILDELVGAGQSGQVPAVHYQHRLIPYQVVAVISPWNVPLLLAMIETGSLTGPSELIEVEFIRRGSAARSQIPQPDARVM